MSMLRTTRFIAAALALALTACSQPQEAKAPEPAVAEAPSAVITSPAANARVTSPLIVEGTAPGDWYFEAQFPTELRGPEGAVIAEAPALAQRDWMTEAPVPYRAELAFRVTQETPATLVLQEDMPADNASPREVMIPVVLVPAN
ncbi:MAG: Gmad2 immunoglobulin-like domain-containing protein [Caulobacteraceae bacterium]